MADTEVPSNLPALRLKRNEDRRLSAGHLWVFSNEVDTVLAHNDRVLGIAYVNPQSLISARLLETWRIPDSGWFVERFRGALALRERLYPEPYYRAVYGEADALPGLVVDRYGNRCVVQIGTAGMELLKPHICEAVIRVFDCETLILKNDSGARELEGLSSYVEIVKGTAAETGVVREGGLAFEVPLAEGQKTGWFFDQAFNRGALTKYIPRNARVLDVFSYVGAWGVRAAHDGAGEVTCVDSSAAALESAIRNAERNGSKIAVRKGDAFDVLEALARESRQFDIVIVDPPAFAKRRKDVPKALAAYKRLNQLAMQVLSPDGILVSCSCSHHVAPPDLEDAIAKAARSAHKRVQIVEVGGQAPDHPVHPAIPETRYLKAYFCRVTDSLK
jgi:23S rRNA (cytosine1962-C5)-methyltransferase